MKRRPTEIASGVTIAGTVTGLLLPALPDPIAVVIGVVCGFGPLVLSNVVDALRRRG